MLMDVFDKDSAKVMTLFSISPGSKFTRNEIKEKTLLNNVSLDKAIAGLLRNRLLLKERRLLHLNFENPSLKSLLETIRKEHARFKEIPLKAYFALAEFSEAIKGNKKVARAYLFGSYAKLIYTEKSDIDIAVVLQKKEKETTEKLKRAAKKIERRCGKNMELHFFETDDMKRKDPLVREILRNGVEI